MRSRVTRRRRVRRSASAAGFRPRASSPATMKRSRSLATSPGSETAGGVAATGLVKLHHDPAASLVMPPRRASRTRGSAAPAAIQVARSSISLGVSAGPASSGGIAETPSACFTARRRRLESLSPGTIAAPESPPVCQPCRESSARPPLVLPVAVEWQPWQRATKSGRMRLSKRSSSAAKPGFAAPTAIASPTTTTATGEKGASHHLPSQHRPARNLGANGGRYLFRCMAARGG